MPIRSPLFYPEEFNRNDSCGAEAFYDFAGTTRRDGRTDHGSPAVLMTTMLPPS